ncbi:MAG: tripartite tricarboxylate transporter substrate binding protein [Burkholderiales bacterium]|nr:tripartite tricarboxylate transporter substrate binding protein [Burkholderiales bacterium]
MKLFSIALRALPAVVLAAGAVHVAAQQNYPARPIRFIIPFPPGGSTDPMGRFVAAKLTERLGQQVIVDNRPGGNTVIGMELGARATPDGYTMVWTSSTLFSMVSLIPNLPFNALRDFTGMGTISKGRSVLVVHPSVPVQSVQELIALAKAKPGQIKYGSSGHGTNTHLNGEIFRLQTGTDIRHIPYKGSGPVTTDLLAGRIEMSFQVPITVIPFINAGKLRPLAVNGEGRLNALAQVPNFSEVGMPGFGLTSITAISMPAKTPRAHINKLSAELAAALGTPETAEFMTKQGAEPFINNPEQTDAVIRSEIARYAKLIKEAGITYQP